MYCGSPAWTAHPPGEIREKQSGRDFYKAHLGDEVDFPADTECFPPERKAMLEGYATTALTFYRDTRSDGGLGFTSPAPDRLGPVVLDEDGERVVRLFADPGFEGLGETANYRSAAQQRLAGLGR